MTKNRVSKRGSSNPSPIYFPVATMVNGLSAGVSDILTIITLVSFIPIPPVTANTVEIHIRMLEKMYHKRLNGYGSIVSKSQIHQKYAVIDQRLVWYGSINILSFGNAEESIMRLDSPNIANELIWSMENS